MGCVDRNDEVDGWQHNAVLQPHPRSYLIREGPSRRLGSFFFKALRRRDDLARSSFIRAVCVSRLCTGNSEDGGGGGSASDSQGCFMTGLCHP